MITAEKTIATSSSKPLSERYYEFDVLRALCVLYITCFFHISEMWLLKLPQGFLVIIAQVVLCIFCFLSGLMFGLRYKFKDSEDVSLFFRKRFWRLYPLYATTLTIFLAIRLIDTKTFLYSIFLLNMPLNIPLLTLWFVSLISIFYLLTPIYLINPSPKRTCTVTFFILCLFAILKYKFQIIDERLINFLIPFAFGILIAQIKTLKTFFLKPKSVTALLLAIFFVPIAIYSIKHPIHDALLLDRTLIITSFLLLLPLSILVSKKLLNILPLKLITVVSGASFMLYLVHRIVYKVGHRIFPTPNYSIESQLYLIFVLIPIAFVISHYMQLNYDKLFDRRSRQKPIS